MSRKANIKIKSLDELEKLLEDLRKKNKRIVLCHGVFDLLHPGHIKYFQSAKQKGDVLVVTITQDEHVNRGPGRPVFNQNVRAETVSAIECVDYVAVNQWPTAVETIKKLKPHFYVKGKDYADKSRDLTGKITEEEDAVHSVGGTLHFTDDELFSSSSLINTFFTPYPAEARDFFRVFGKRYSADDVIQSLKAVADVKVLVIGDIIIDEYHYCKGIGKSQKDNIIATRFLSKEIFAGGVLAAANHLAGFCDNTCVLTGIGTTNDYSEFIDTHLNPSVRRRFFPLPESPTVVKRRYVDPDFLTKLFEICYLEGSTCIDKRTEDKIVAYLKAHLKDFDMVLVADFGHGLISPRIVETLCEKAPYIALNCQTNSANIGFNLVTKFPRADYVCIDEPEIRLACHDRISPIEELMKTISKKLKCDKVIITRGHRGALAYSKKSGFVSVPVFSKEIVDRIGAGDAFFAVTSPCVFRGAPLDMAGFIGNAVGAMQVLIVGNRTPVDPGALFKYITTLLK